MTHMALKQLPPVGHPSTNHDHFGIQNIDEIRQSNAEIIADAMKYLESKCIACHACDEYGLCRKIICRIQARCRMARPALAGHADDCRRGRIDFEAAAAPAATRHAAEWF